MEYTTRYRMVRRDGSLRWVYDRGRVVCEEQGRLAIISSCMDIDESIAVRQKLQAAQEDQWFLNEHAIGGYHQFYDCEGYLFRHISTRFTSILGIDDKQIREQFHNSMLELIPREDHTVFTNMLASMKATGSCHGEIRMISASGILRVNFQGFYVRKQNKSYIAASILNLETIRKGTQCISCIPL